MNWVVLEEQITAFLLFPETRGRVMPTSHIQRSPAEIVDRRNVAEFPSRGAVVVLFQSWQAKNKTKQNTKKQGCTIVPHIQITAFSAHFYSFLVVHQKIKTPPPTPPAPPAPQGPGNTCALGLFLDQWFLDNFGNFKMYNFTTYLKLMYSFGKWWTWKISLMGFVYRVVWVLKALWIILSETIKILRKLHKANIFGMPPKNSTIELCT